MGLFGDLKHFMGPRLRTDQRDFRHRCDADSDTPRNNHAGDVLTENLWGSGPLLLHARRRSTTAEAIIEHGMAGDNTSEGRFSRANFINASTSQRQLLIAHLENLVLFKIEEEEEAAAAAVH